MIQFTADFERKQGIYHLFRINLLINGKPILSFLADLECFAAWNSEHGADLFGEWPDTLPPLTKSSIAENIDSIKKTEWSTFEQAEFIHDELLSFSEKHSLRFIFRGVDIPDVYIASRDGKIEISCVDPTLKIFQAESRESFFWFEDNGHFRNL